MFSSPGCSKRPSSKAAGESKPEAYPRGYVEDCDEPRTKLGAFFSFLLRLFDRFFDQRLVSLCLEGHHGLTFRKITRDGEFLWGGRFGGLNYL